MDVDVFNVFVVSLDIHRRRTKAVRAPRADIRTYVRYLQCDHFLQAPGEPVGVTRDHRVAPRQPVQAIDIRSDDRRIGVVTGRPERSGRLIAELLIFFVLR